MATFEYQALTQSNRLMKGTIEAASQDEAGLALMEMGLQVSSLDKAAHAPVRTPVGRSEFVLFNRQLAAIAKAGIPLERGLRELAHDVESKRMRKLVEEVAADLESGVSVEEAFEKRQRRFPPLYSQILKAGVETGRLSEMLLSLNRHIELAGHTRRIVLEAVSYPAVVVALAAVIISGVFTFVLPAFRPLLTDMAGGTLPALTDFFLGIGQYVIWFWVAVGLMFAVSAFLWVSSASSPGGRRVRETVALKTPLIGRVYRGSILGRMAEAMAMLVAAGSDMPRCLRLATSTSGSASLAAEGDLLAAQIEKGTGLLEAGRLCRVIPRLLLYSVQVGSQRDELKDNLHSLAQMYAEQARSSQVRLQTILLPTMLLFVGSIVLLLVLSVFMPIVQMIMGLSS